MSTPQRPNTSDQQFTMVLVEQCHDIYRKEMKDKALMATESDQFYQAHTDALFLSLATFSENFTTKLIKAEYLVDLTRKLKAAYRNFKKQFDSKQAAIKKESNQKLQESLKKYNTEMTKTSEGVTPETLEQAHNDALKIAETHFKKNKYPKAELIKQAHVHMRDCIKIKEEVYKVKNGIEINLDDDWFAILKEALESYSKRMTEKCEVGSSNNEIDTAHDDASKKAKDDLKKIKRSSTARFNYATSLLESSMELLRNNLYLQQPALDINKIGISITPEEIFIKPGDDGFLGRGGYGGVYLGYVKYLDVVAIKCQLLHGSKDAINKNRNKFIKEVKLLSETNHSNIVRVQGYASWRSSIAIVMEYLPGGNLNDILLNECNISANLKLRFCADISSGITYLHNGFNDKRMVHGDLKPANILLTSDLRCKVADFGGAEYATQTEDVSKFRPGVGERTEGFAAPERIKNPHAQLQKKMDVYSYGVIVYVVLERRSPNKTYDYFKTEVTNCSEKHSTQDESSTKLLSAHMVKCCDEDPIKRPSMMEVRDQILEVSCLLDVVTITRDIADVIEKKPFQIPFLQVQDCKKLSDFGDQL